MTKTINATPNTRSQQVAAFTKSNTFAQIGMAVSALLAWEIASRFFKLEFWISRPTEVIQEFSRWAESGQLATDLKITLLEAGLGFLFGSVAGGFIGFLLGWVRKLGDLFEPFILSLYSVPKIALAPLFVLWFGIGVTNKVMFSAMLVFFMVFFTTYQGTRQVDRDLVENARLMGAQNWDIWTKIAIPYSGVWVLTGIRIGLPYALIGAIVGEFVASDAGVGYRIKEATAFMSTASVFAGIIVLTGISLTLLTILKLIESRVLRWQNASGVIKADDIP